MKKILKLLNYNRNNSFPKYKGLISKLIYDPFVLKELRGQLEPMIWNQSSLYTGEEDKLIGRILIVQWCLKALIIAETALVLKNKTEFNLDRKYINVLNDFDNENRPSDIIKFFPLPRGYHRFILRKARFFFQEEESILRVGSPCDNHFNFVLSRNEIAETWCQNHKIKCYLLEETDIFGSIKNFPEPDPIWGRLAGRFVDYFVHLLKEKNITPPANSLAWLHKQICFSSQLVFNYLTCLLKKTLPSQFIMSCHGNVSEQIIAHAMFHQGKSVIGVDHGLGLCIVRSNYLKLYSLSATTSYISYNSISCNAIRRSSLSNQDSSDDLFCMRLSDTKLLHINSLSRKKKAKKDSLTAPYRSVFEPFFSPSHALAPDSYFHAINSLHFNIHILRFLIQLKLKISLRPHPSYNRKVINKLLSYFDSHHVQLAKNNMESICDLHDLVIMTDSTTTAMKAVLSSATPFIVFDCHPYRNSDFVKEALNAHGVYREINLRNSIESQISLELIENDINIALGRTLCQDPFWF